MVEKKDFRFISVWECMAWIGFKPTLRDSRISRECLQYHRPGGKNRANDPALVGGYDKQERKN